MPITKVNGELIGDGKVGGNTRKLHEIYWEKHKDSGWSVSINEILTR